MPRAPDRNPGRGALPPLALAVCLLPLLTAAALASAQETSAPGASAAPPARELPTPEQLEPGVNTSAPLTPAPAGATTGVVDRPAANPAASASPAAPPAGKGSAAQPKNPTGAKASPVAQGSAPAKGKGKGASRLELEATEITGNRELPKVLYIVPWKRSDLGELVGRPVNSLLDEVLQPLDRDVFQRENRYYHGLQSGAAGAPKPDSAPPAETNP